VSDAWPTRRDALKQGPRHRLHADYYLSLLSTSQRLPTQHCGLVIFDEPGQQEMEKLSLTAFPDWASKKLGANQQVIVATSEERELLAAVLESSPAKLTSFDSLY
jgi:hypothetical protein